ncbi:MAG: sulfate adenylyltransferase, partial [bacterium]
MDLIAAHGGVLVNRVLRGDEREASLDKLNHLKKLCLSSTSISDLELIAVGAFSPLTGFMNQADYESVVENMRLANGLVWSIPITLPVSNDFALEVKLGEEIVLTTEDDFPVGLLTI